MVESLLLNGCCPVPEGMVAHYLSFSEELLRTENKMLFTRASRGCNPVNIRRFLLIPLSTS